MDKLNFYTVDFEYVKFLKEAEQEYRGFSRVPNVEYGEQRKPKFLCGIVLQKLIHAKKPETIQRYMAMLELDAPQLAKVNTLRKMLKNAEIHINQQ